MVGRLGSFEMSAAVLATTLYNVSGLSLLLGFASAMETFCGQAYGARNYKLVGVVLQRGMVSAGRRARQAAHQRDAMYVPIGPLVMVEQLQVPGVWCWSRQAATASSTRHAAHPCTPPHTSADPDHPAVGVRCCAVDAGRAAAAVLQASKQGALQSFSRQQPGGRPQPTPAHARVSPAARHTIAVAWLQAGPAAEPLSGALHPAAGACAAGTGDF